MHRFMIGEGKDPEDTFYSVFSGGDGSVPGGCIRAKLYDVDDFNKGYDAVHALKRQLTSGERSWEDLPTDSGELLELL